MTVGGPSAGLETDFRPHLFAGVATIVAKLLLAGLPDRAYFGEKDFQQLLVVKKLVRDLGIPTEIVGCPTVREADGLALSSRNAYLSADERARAPKLHAALQDIARRIREGETTADALAAGRATLTERGLRRRLSRSFGTPRRWRPSPMSGQNRSACSSQQSSARPG